MKKFLILAVLAVLSTTAYAQVENGFRMGIRVNAGVSNVVYEGDKSSFGYGLG